MFSSFIFSSIFDPWLVESADAEPMGMEGQIYLEQVSPSWDTWLVLLVGCYGDYTSPIIKPVLLLSTPANQSSLNTVFFSPYLTHFFQSMHCCFSIPQDVTNRHPTQGGLHIFLPETVLIFSMGDSELLCSKWTFNQLHCHPLGAC